MFLMWWMGICRQKHWLVANWHAICSRARPLIVGFESGVDMLDIYGSQDDVRDIVDLLDATHADYFLVLHVPGENGNWYYGSNNLPEESFNELIESFENDI